MCVASVSSVRVEQRQTGAASQINWMNWHEQCRSVYRLFEVSTLIVFCSIVSLFCVRTIGCRFLSARFSCQRSPLSLLPTRGRGAAGSDRRQLSVKISDLCDLHFQSTQARSSNSGVKGLIASPCLSVRVHQGDSNQADFNKISDFGCFLNFGCF